MSVKVKNCVVVPIFLSAKILVAIDLHQGNNIVDVFGAVVKEGEDNYDAALRAVPGIIPANYTLTPFGSFVDFVTKPEGITELRVTVYKCLLTPGEYQIESDRRPEWLTRKQLFEDPRNRRNSRLFDRFFDPTPLQLEIHEDQMNLWIDAKITTWTEIN